MNELTTNFTQRATHVCPDTTNQAALVASPTVLLPPADGHLLYSAVYPSQPYRTLLTAWSIALLALGLLLLLLPQVSQAQGTLTVTPTVGTASNLCPTTPVVAVNTNATVYFCVTLTNRTDAVLTEHTVTMILPQLTNPTRTLTFTTNLPPGQSVAVNQSYLTGIGVGESLAASASQAFTNTVTVTSTNGSTTVRGSGQARVVIGAVGMTLVNTVGTDANQCSSTTGVAVSRGSTVYYCVTLTKSGNLTFTRHRLVDTALGVDITITNPGAYILDNNPVEITSAIEPLTKTITQNFTNTVTLTSYTPEGVAVSAQATARAIVGSATTAVTNTVGTRSGECASTTAVTVTAGSIVYHCISIKNQGTEPLTRHEISAPQLGLTQVLTKTIRTGEVLTVTNQTFSQLQSTASAALTNTVTVRSVSRNGAVTTDTAAARVNLGTAALTVTKYPQRDPNTCVKNTSLNILSNEPFYYCLVVRNNSQLPLVNHNFTEANLQLSSRYSYTLAAGALLTITNQLMADTLQIAPALGPLRVTTSINNQVVYTARTSANIVATAVANAAVNIVFPTATRTTAPTPSPTLSPTPTPSPTITPTPIPTETPTNVVLSLPPTPTSVFGLNSIETPTPNVFGAVQDPNFTSPIETPFVPLPDFTPDFTATTFALTAEAVATQNSLAFLPTSPLPTLSETPTLPLSPATVVVETPTPTTIAAVVVATPSPLPLPPTTGEPLMDYLNLLAGMLAVSTATLGWIWFLMGSIIFFAVAGLFAGLTFRQQEHRRYMTAATEEDAFPGLDDPAEAALASAGSVYYMTDAAEDGYTVATSNASRGPQSAERERRTPTAVRPPDELESDDFWPPSLR